ncbi:ribosomal RNA processing protein 1 homolog [Manihot esculenta]|uniref:Ribosomal RNA processing protein 1 homolog n=1 Tax=Manihot esculenta TaxID=3983 RepID=A0A2C9WC19_MANES|nr:ribosomal RNA processing protein 1 homolog [Manihot esculenta]OAY57225.1 hypothetical protein MANES_02G080100v8 [Manihot esculenta]
MDGAQAGLSLIKQLASCDNKSRNRSLGVLLKTWLPSQSQISDDDMKKLWKGLFYCVWHADKLPAQSHLIDRLSSILPQLHLPVSVQYFSVFLLTMRREWTGIDGLRLDKFYLLIRKFMHFFFLLLKKNSWDLELSARLMSVLVENTFLADDKLLGNGVNYHIASVFLEELRPLLPLSKEVVDVLLGPFVSIMGKMSDKILLGKIKSNVFDWLLKMGNKLLEIKKSMVDVDSGDDAFVLGSIALAFGFSAKFYELGSAVECPQGNRKVLFGLHEQFLKLEKDFASLGIDISLPEIKEDTDEDEVPNLVPLSTGMEGAGSDTDMANMSGSKRLKKCKKGKKASSSSRKKTKKQKDLISDCDTEEDDNTVVPNCGKSNEESNHDSNLITFNESVISNLQMQFEKVATEVNLDKNVGSACDFLEVSGNGIVSKKRKRAKGMDKQQSDDPELRGEVNDNSGATVKSTEKSAKKVRFSMKNNLVWKPHSPLPPQSLRIPPSVTPRGSALKKGIPPGPIREMPATKKAKQKAKAVKKSRKVIIGVAPAIKRLKKLKTVSI